MSRALRPLLLIFAIVLSVPVHAQDEERDTASQREYAGDRVREVERDGGRVLQAQPMQRSGREVYRLKVITPEGRVRVLDDGRRRDSRQDNFERRRINYGDDGRPAPMRSERSFREPDMRRQPEMRREPPPATERMDGPRPEPARADGGPGGSPNY